MTRYATGRKIIMAVSGQAMVVYAVLHLIGNSNIYFGLLNSYAGRMHAFPPVLWTFRLAIFLFFSLHVLYGIQLNLENRTSKPQAYAVRKSLRATFASKNMIWTGFIIGVFLIFHLLHFTFHVIGPESVLVKNAGISGQTDVFGMVVLNFRSSVTVGLYIVAMVALLLHLTHGIQSSFQSLGLSGESTGPLISRCGSIAAILLFLGYVSIPVAIIAGVVKG